MDGPHMHMQLIRRLSILSLAFLAVLWLSSASFEQCHAADGTTTWADSHPEVVELFGLPFTPEGSARRKNFPTWPAEEFKTRIVASQPTVVRSENEGLIAHSWAGIARSQDGGRSWKEDSKPPEVERSRTA